MEEEEELISRLAPCTPGHHNVSYRIASVGSYSCMNMFIMLHKVDVFLKFEDEILFQCTFK